jgi:hypothetical protein
MTRDTCGSVRGALDHLKHHEPVCGWCAYAEQARRIAAEGIPHRITPPPPPEQPGYPLQPRRPVTPGEAAEHLRVLARELKAFDFSHPGHHWRDDPGPQAPRKAPDIPAAGYPAAS